MKKFKFIDEESTYIGIKQRTIGIIKADNIKEAFKKVSKIDKEVKLDSVITELSNNKFTALGDNFLHYIYALEI